MRCKVCDREYSLPYLQLFKDEGYCPVCENAISIAIWEMENEDYPQEGEEDGRDR